MGTTGSLCVRAHVPLGRTRLRAPFPPPGQSVAHLELPGMGPEGGPQRSPGRPSFLLLTWVGVLQGRLLEEAPRTCASGLTEREVNAVMMVTTTRHSQWQQHPCPANEHLCVCQARLSAVAATPLAPRGLHSSGQMLLNLLLTAGCW